MIIKGWIKKFWPLILFVSIVITFSIFSYVNNGIIYSLTNNDIDSAVEYMESLGNFAILAFLLLVILEVVLAPIPPLILYIIGGILFGTLFGGILSLVGNMIGAVIAFYIGRSLGKDYIDKKFKKGARIKFDKFTKKYGLFSLFLLRINPLTSSDIFSYLAGITKMSIRQLIIGTTLGLAPLIFIQTYLGNDIIKGNPILYLIFILVGVAYFAAFIYGIFYIWFKGRKSKN